ncbi:hypothetical protein AVEN_186217-1 [Araneus ventricosus]|uniref:Uncharacterized protein n=1 Tax=Araneus ventricosus TaxID=182803 RepID=A0A4Y2KA43_ARAVE|nr:hypothetical protein AVEN_103273-1 [Araneus ventricosus]GBM98515.1 hypothetical protein AVEN_186217-1 [Araneus ventricosus]
MMDVMRQQGNISYLESTLQTSLASKVEMDMLQGNQYTHIYTTYSDGNYSPSSSPVSITPVPSPGHNDNANAIRTFYDLTNCSPMKMVNNTAFVFPETNLAYKGSTAVTGSIRQTRHYSPIAPKTISDLSNSFTFSNTPDNVQDTVLSRVQDDNTSPSYAGGYRTVQNHQSQLNLNSNIPGEEEDMGG